MQVHYFYNVLTETTRTLLDASAGGALIRKSEDKYYQLLENMAINNSQWPSKPVSPEKLAGKCDIVVFLNLVAQFSLLTKKLQAT